MLHSMSSACRSLCHSLLNSHKLYNLTRGQCLCEVGRHSTVYEFLHFFFQRSGQRWNLRFITNTHNVSSVSVCLQQGWKDVFHTHGRWDVSFVFTLFISMLTCLHDTLYMKLPLAVISPQSQNPWSVFYLSTWWSKCFQSLYCTRRMWLTFKCYIFYPHTPLSWSRFWCKESNPRKTSSNLSSTYERSLW